LVFLRHFEKCIFYVKKPLFQRQKSLAIEQNEMDMEIKVEKTI